MELNKIHIYGAIFQFEGQISVFNYQGGPRYQDFHNKASNENILEDTCSNAGVLGLLPGIIGTLQATEAVKIILGYQSILSGIILKYNALTLSFEKFEIINTNFILSQENKQNNNPILSFDNSLIQEINVVELAELLSQDNLKYMLFDVRSLEEYQKIHLKNAIHLPLRDLEKLDSSNLKLQNKKCFVYCSLDSRSLFASSFLIKQNFNIVRVKGGLSAWKNILGTKNLCTETIS